MKNLKDIINFSEGDDEIHARIEYGELYISIENMEDFSSIELDKDRAIDFANKILLAFKN